MIAHTIVLEFWYLKYIKICGLPESKRGMWMEEILLDIKPMMQSYCELFQTEPDYPLLRCVPNINAAHAALKPHQKVLLQLSNL